MSRQQIKYDKKGLPIRPNTVSMPAWERDAVTAQWRKAMERYERDQFEKQKEKEQPADSAKNDHKQQRSYDRQPQSNEELDNIRTTIREYLSNYVNKERDPTNSEKLRFSINNARSENLQQVLDAINSINNEDIINTQINLYDKLCEYLGVCHYTYCLNRDCKRPHVYKLCNQKSRFELLTGLTAVDEKLAQEDEKNKLASRLKFTHPSKLLRVKRYLRDYNQSPTEENQTSLVKELHNSGIICRFAKCNKEPCKYPHGGLKCVYIQVEEQADKPAEEPVDKPADDDHI